MKDEILLSLLSEVKPRIELDWDKIDHRFIPRDEKKDKKSKPVSSDTSSHHREFLKDVFDNPDIPITIRGGRLGYTSHMTTKVKNELIEKGLVIEYEVNLGRPNKFLELTEAGYRYLNIPTPPRKGKGSPEHRYWQRRVLDYYRRRGLKAKIEAYKDGKLVDVGVIEEDGRLLAVEVALRLENEMRNIKEDIAVGFDKVLIACKNRRLKQEVEKIIAENLPHENRDKVQTCLLTDFT